MNKLMSAFLDILYPKKNYCCICGREAPRAICELCLSSIKYINGRTCLKCGKNLKDSYIQMYCPNCYEMPYFFDSAYSCFEYEGMGKEIIHKMKYEGKLQIARLLADFMYEKLKYECIGVQAIIPVPIHPRKYQKRGFNQANIIAQHLGRKTKLPVSDCIKRIRETTDQFYLNKQQRLLNVIDAFSVEIGYNISNYSTVLLLDDVFTTGSTVSECSKVLKMCGVQQVHVITAGSGSNT